MPESVPGSSEQINKTNTVKKKVQQIDAVRRYRNVRAVQMGQVHCKFAAGYSKVRDGESQGGLENWKLPRRRIDKKLELTGDGSGSGKEGEPGSGLGLGLGVIEIVEWLLYLTGRYFKLCCVEYLDCHECLVWGVARVQRPMFNPCKLSVEVKVITDDKSESLRTHEGKGFA